MSTRGAQNLTRVDRSRRIPRGRGGATDGNIPHYIARSERRRRQELRAAAAQARADRLSEKEKGERFVDNVPSSQDCLKEEPEFCGFEIENAVTETREQPERTREQPERKLGAHPGRRDSSGSFDCFAATHTERCGTASEHDVAAFTTDQDTITNWNQQVLEEVKHLRRRLKNVQSSMRQCDVADQQSWGVNSLNATYNCVQEWYSIVTYRSDVERGTDLLLTPQAKEVPGEVFGLIQMALQSGPLTGSNAGYFKRCGSDVAALACEFLDRVLYLLVIPEQFCISDRKCAGATAVDCAEECSDSEGDSRWDEQGSEVKRGQPVTSSVSPPKSCLHAWVHSQSSGPVTEVEIKRPRCVRNWKTTLKVVFEEKKPSDIKVERE